MIEFIRGIWTPVSTVWMPASARTSSIRGVLRVAVADQVLRLDSGVVQVHGQVLDCLGDPGRGWMCGGAQDAYAAGGVFDGGEDVVALPGQGDGLDEVHGEQCVCLGAQE
ncbi:hypothetical protein, partial [Amycolatopsis sp.]|uniref:hypothetical protein n=1 Tax=Amycolatopsis sp. TaxID=37632 RepID=UPI0026155F1C